MLTGPEVGRFRPQKGPTGLSRTIAYSWRGLYGRDPFSSMWRGGRYEVLLNGEFGANNSIFAVYYVREKALVSGRAAAGTQGSRT
jgi:hypothetical protein